MVLQYVDEARNTMSLTHRYCLTLFLIAHTGFSKDSSAPKRVPTKGDRGQCPTADKQGLPEVESNLDFISLGLLFATLECGLEIINLEFVRNEISECILILFHDAEC